METTVWTFDLSVPFAEWAAIYDSDDVVKMHAEAGIKSLFRGVSKDNPLRSAQFIKLLLVLHRNFLKTIKK